MYYFFTVLIFFFFFNYSGRWSWDCPWETGGLSADFDWKKIVKPVMAHYIETTDGSFIGQKESALLWHHQEADPFAHVKPKSLLIILRMCLLMSQ